MIARFAFSPSNAGEDAGFLQDQLPCSQRSVSRPGRPLHAADFLYNAHPPVAVTASQLIAPSYRTKFKGLGIQVGCELKKCTCRPLLLTCLEVSITYTSPTGSAIRDVAARRTLKSLDSFNFPSGIIIYLVHLVRWSSTDRHMHLLLSDLWLHVLLYVV